MFSRVKEPSLLELEVDRTIRALKSDVIGSDDYVKTLDVVAKLHKMKLEEKSFSVGKDTLAIVGANLFGILMILRYERVDVITSRAMNLILKPR